MNPQDPVFPVIRFAGLSVLGRDAGFDNAVSRRCGQKYERPKKEPSQFNRACQVIPDRDTDRRYPVCSGSNGRDKEVPRVRYGGEDDPPQNRGDYAIPDWVCVFSAHLL